jgi:hypothetical protein
MADSSPFTLDVGSATSSALGFLQNALTGARTAAIQVENHTSYTLFYQSPALYHGGFGVLPALQIEGNKVNLFGAQNAGGSIMTGTEGWVTYGLNVTNDPNASMDMYFQIYWDNPYIGDNNASAALTGNFSVAFKARYGIGSGNAANFVYSLWGWDQIAGNQIDSISG